MKTKLLLAALLLPFSLSAQGELGFGETDDSMQSLAERVANIEQKFKAFNVYVNFNGNFHAMRNGWDGPTESEFQAKNLRLEMKGQIGDNVFYRVRHRLNKPANALHDGLAKATDYAMVGYRFNPQWMVSVGKMGQYFAGFEFDQNAIYVYQASDINDNADGSKLGVAVTYSPSKTQQLVLQVTNAFNATLEEEYAGIGAQGINPSHNPFTYVANWSGQFAEGFYRAKAAFVHRSLATNQGSNVFTCGQSINGDWGRVFLDYACEFDDFDYMRFCSNEVRGFQEGKYMAKGQSWLTDMTYHGIVARTDVKVGSHLIVWAEGMYQTASCGSVEELDGFRKHYNYMAGLEFVPNPNYKVRYTLNYQGQYFDYSKRCGLADYSTNRIEVGILCRLKCF